MDAIKSALPRRPPLSETGQPRLSSESYPTFLPHITLTTVPFSDPGILDVLLAAVPGHHHQPIRANFQSLAVSDHYFRSVLIDVQPTRELVDFQNQILADLRRGGLEPSAPRFPHMSLCYIADQDRADRERAARALEESGCVSQIAGAHSISLRCDDHVSLSGFDGTEVWVVSCDGPVETWKADESRKVKLISKSY